MNLSLRLHRCVIALTACIAPACALTVAPGDGATSPDATADRAPLPACAPQDARGVDPSCPAILGVRWDGTRCDYVGGCNCEGRDCRALYATLQACELAHAACLPPRDAGRPIVDGAVTTCVEAPVSELRLPARMYSFDSVWMTAISDRSGGCSCRPALRMGRDERSYSIQLCDCCADCQCVDPAYEVSTSLGALPLGTHRVRLGAQSATVEIVDSRLECTNDIRVDSVEVVGPGSGRRRGEPPVVWWARVHASVRACCGDGSPVAHLQRNGPTLTLNVASCQTTDCDLCASPAPWRPATFWHPLGELSANNYTLRAGEQVVRFSTP